MTFWQFFWSMSRCFSTHLADTFCNQSTYEWIDSRDIPI
jgi:hypothetical protein